jgi:type III secretory pathway component EscR
LDFNCQSRENEIFEFVKGERGEHLLNFYRMFLFKWSTGELSALFKDITKNCANILKHTKLKEDKSILKKLGMMALKESNILSL